MSQNEVINRITAMVRANRRGNTRYEEPSLNDIERGKKRRKIDLIKDLTELGNELADPWDFLED